MNAGPGLMRRWMELLFSSFGWRGATANVSSSARVIKAFGHDYVAGLSWRSPAGRSEINEALRQAKGRGISGYVKGESDQYVGLWDGAVGRKNYSLGMQVLESVSQGGLELFAFQLSKDEVFVFAAIDSCPVPGFDFLGSDQEAKTIAEEFLGVQSNQVVRQVGNAEILPRLETIDARQVFASPDSAARILAVPDFKKRFVLSLAVAIVAAIAVAGYSWKEYRDAQLLKKEQQRQVKSPNQLYEESIGAALEGAGPPGEVRLHQWRNVYGMLPSEVGGWELTAVECGRSQCTAKWKRVYGNLKDFVASVPLNGRMEPVAKVVGERVNTDEILTIHSLVEAAAKPTLERARLPDEAGLQATVYSDFQDLSLAGINVSFGPHKLFPEGKSGDTAGLQSPVFSGAWTITAGIWSIGDLKLGSESMIPETLSVTIEKTGIDYTLKGRYYFKGKNA